MLATILANLGETVVSGDYGVGVVGNTLLKKTELHRDGLFAAVSIAEIVDGFLFGLSVFSQAIISIHETCSHRCRSIYND